MQKKRLLKLAALLETDAKNKKGIRFDLGTFGEVGDETAPISCGTTACALGLAALSGAFKRQGLTCKIEDGAVDIIFGHSHNFNAATNFFDIDYAVSKWLFHPFNYDGPTEGAAGERAVAKRIRRFVAGKSAPPDSMFV